MKIHDQSYDWYLGYMVCWSRINGFHFEESLKSMEKDTLFEMYLTTVP